LLRASEEIERLVLALDRFFDCLKFH
jgi:hypothetical protein